MSYTVIYRTGGKERCRWKKCLPVETREQAIEKAKEIQVMGYRTIIHKTKDLEVVGMPEGWNA